jgi:hypothetical protein
MEQPRCGVQRTFARSPSLSINQVKQHTNARCIAPRFLERRRPRELVEDRAPVHGWSGKLDEL